MAGKLAGIRVLVTRPAHQAATLTHLIEAAGGEAIRFPVVEILEPEDSTVLLRIIDRLDDFDMAIFISPNAVNKALNLILARRTLPPRLEMACVGRGSAKELKHFGIDNVIVPSGRFDSEGLLALQELTEVQGKKIVIFRGDGGREVLGNTLAARGAQVEYAECYRRAKPTADSTLLMRRWARGGIDAVTVTSVAGLRNLFDIVGKLGQQWLVKTPTVVVSERMAEVCRELGYKAPPLVADEASDEGILRALETWRETQKPL